jgi:ABC-type transporter Mla subunit MlaD
MDRRRGKTIGTFLIGAFVLIAFAYSLFGDSTGWRTMPSPVMKAEVPQSDRSMAVGANVLAADGTKVGSVSGISRGADGHVERIRVITDLRWGWVKGL